ncbi:MAG: hypothetical protein ACRD5Z_09250, partial [Bryobacteraceae bacterium]
LFIAHQLPKGSAVDEVFSYTQMRVVGGRLAVYGIPRKESEAFMRKSCARLVATLRSVLAVLAVAMLPSCAGYVPGEKAYWDAKVKEMCDKDGGITVYERVKISRREARSVLIDHPPTQKARRNQPYVWEQNETVIRDSNPRVVRSEILIKRRSDDKILGKTVQYWRSGGDFPTGISEPTSFICPQHAALSEEVFSIEEGNNE